MTTPAIPRSAMTKTDVALLLAFIASYDQRTIGEADVEAWHLLTAPGRWTLPYARRAVIEYVNESTSERLLPGHITQRIRAQREHFASTYRHEAIPAGVRDVDDQIRWEQDQRRAHIEACMGRWAAGQEAAA